VWASSAGAGIRPLGFPRIGAGGRSALRTCRSDGTGYQHYEWVLLNWS